MTFNSVPVKLTTMTSWKKFTNMLTKLLALYRKAFQKTPDFCSATLQSRAARG
jgi:hypothetical protein